MRPCFLHAVRGGPARRRSSTASSGSVGILAHGRAECLLTHGRAPASHGSVTLTHGRIAYSSHGSVIHHLPRSKAASTSTLEKVAKSLSGVVVVAEEARKSGSWLIWKSLNH